MCLYLKNELIEKSLENLETLWKKRQITFVHIRTRRRCDVRFSMVQICYSENKIVI